MKYEVMVTAHCYKTVCAENRSEAIDKALFMVEDSDFEIDGAEITHWMPLPEPPKGNKNGRTMLKLQIFCAR